MAAIDGSDAKCADDMKMMREMHQNGTQKLGHLAQQLVPNRMSGGIVDKLELVQVDVLALVKVHGL